MRTGALSCGTDKAAPLDAEALRHFSEYPASNLASPADPGLMGRLAMRQVMQATDLSYIVIVLVMFEPFVATRPSMWYFDTVKH
ncbi:hypothetical protein MAE02_60980 [Microvirga aerophila]|uniref:Uncharacterized protein n=1 Tax=Microvirga aerophila TaxID=670291 RepID=A0A512C2F9_9HYPH|nr:hypothetical protein MAE02_60980 [Microvirga aerophila]